MKKKNVSVAVIMGSDSDYKIMKDAVRALKEFGQRAKVQVLSAHRTPKEMVEFATSAKAHGIRVIIAGAGGAAHLPGMVASLTEVPVIGVPIELKTLRGVDSLLSIVQMPKGVPVATVAINGAYNAGLLACRILSVGDDKFSQKLSAQLGRYRDGLRKAVLRKSRKKVFR